MTQLWGRPDLDKFQVGAFYQHSETDLLVEFVGIALNGVGTGEDVGVFRLVDEGDFLLATEKGWRQGETFRRFADVEPRILTDEDG